MILSDIEGLGKMALEIVKYFYDCPSQPVEVNWFVVSLFVVSCCGPTGSGLPVILSQSNFIIMILPQNERVRATSTARNKKTGGGGDFVMVEAYSNQSFNLQIEVLICFYFTELLEII